MSHCIYLPIFQDRTSRRERYKLVYEYIRLQSPITSVVFIPFFPFYTFRYFVHALHSTATRITLQPFTFTSFHLTYTQLRLQPRWSTAEYTKPDPGPFCNHSLSSPTLAVASTKQSPAKTLNFLKSKLPKSQVKLLCADLVFDDLSRRLDLTSHTAWFAEGLLLPVGACGEEGPPPRQDLKQQRAMIQISIKRIAQRRQPAWH